MTRPTPLAAGTVYIACGDGDLEIQMRLGRPTDKTLVYHPNVDRMVKSALGNIPAKQLVGVLLTGMGRDGAAMTALHGAGGRTIAETEDSAVVFGIPAALIASGGATVTLPGGQGRRPAHRLALLRASAALLASLAQAAHRKDRAMQMLPHARRRAATPGLTSRSPGASPLMPSADAENRAPSSAARASLLDSEFRRFQALFSRKTGIMFTEAKRDFVAKRIAGRLVEMRLRNPSEYLDRLAAEPDGAEMQAPINAMTVNETYSNRETYQLRALSDQILPQVTAGRERGERVRIWSIPCSTGEEPYSLAIRLLEDWAEVDNFAVEIVASDIDTKVLAEARQECFSQRSVQHIAPDGLARDFTRSGRGEYQIIDELRRSIELPR